MLLCSVTSQVSRLGRSSRPKLTWLSGASAASRNDNYDCEPRRDYITYHGHYVEPGGNANGTTTSMELGRRKKRVGYWGAKGWAKPGYPNTTPIRIKGVDENLQERLDRLFAEENAIMRNRADIGFPPKNTNDPGEKRRQSLQWRHQRRADASMERAARHGTLHVDLADVAREHIKSGAIYDTIREAADLYGIFEDLFGEGKFFTPCLHFRPEYDFDEEYITPVHRGNIIKPKEATSEPFLAYDGGDSLWTVILSNPDGHFTDEDSEYLHWMVTNIKGSDLSTGETLCHYMQPFPPFGTGYHRYIFVLYKQNGPLDLSKHRLPSPCHDLTAKTFRTRDFLAEVNGENQDARPGERPLTPAGLAFFQSDWDSTLKDFFHNTLDMKEPKYEYHFVEPYIKPWTHFVPWEGRVPFNLFLDKMRDPKEIQEELVRKKLATHHPFEGDMNKDIKYPNAHVISPDLPQWRRREIERERLRQGVFKDLDWKKLRRDPTNA